jgi:glycosyltransferase involved in cell wall biosynthesis
MPPGASSANKALFLSPEAPLAAAGGGGLRSASLLGFLQSKYDVTVASFTLPYHSKNRAARVWRNSWRLVRGVPPLLDRFAGFESQLAPHLKVRYKVGVIEHFWCAPYADALRPHCDLLVLDLHNIESELAATHAQATSGLESFGFAQFSKAYRRLEKQWLPKFDLILTTSEDDRRRVDHSNVVVFPNALPLIDVPQVEEENCIVFSGNLEYHPNVEAVRWFAQSVWPEIRSSGVEWRLVGRNAHAVEHLVKHDSSVRMTGEVDDAIREIARARVCVVPLLSGSGTRFKILEAWAAKRAVVSTSIGAEGLEAVDGTHLRIADDPEVFAEIVRELLSDDAQRKALGDAGRALYEQRYTWPAAWKKIEPVFSDS